MLPFCSAPLIALLVAGEVEDCSMMDKIMLGYHNISYLINAPIYLVKGGRLGLMPGVGPNRVDCGATSGQLEVWFYS